jgi:hypothetical protein
MNILIGFQAVERVSWSVTWLVWSMSRTVLRYGFLEARAAQALANPLLCPRVQQICKPPETSKPTPSLEPTNRAATDSLSVAVLGLRQKTATTLRALLSRCHVTVLDDPCARTTTALKWITILPSPTCPTVAEPWQSGSRSCHSVDQGMVATEGLFTMHVLSVLIGAVRISRSMPPIKHRTRLPRVFTFRPID